MQLWAIVLELRPLMSCFGFTGSTCSMGLTHVLIASSASKRQELGLSLSRKRCKNPDFIEQVQVEEDPEGCCSHGNGKSTSHLEVVKVADSIFVSHKAGERHVVCATEQEENGLPNAYDELFDEAESGSLDAHPALLCSLSVSFCNIHWLLLRGSDCPSLASQFTYEPSLFQSGPY